MLNLLLFLEETRNSIQTFHYSCIFVCILVLDSPILKQILKHVITIQKTLDVLMKETHTQHHEKETHLTNFDHVPKKQFKKFRKLLQFDENLKTDENVCMQNVSLFIILCYAVIMCTNLYGPSSANMTYRKQLCSLLEGRHVRNTYVVD